MDSEARRVLDPRGVELDRQIHRLCLCFNTKSLQAGRSLRVFGGAGGRITDGNSAGEGFAMGGDGVEEGGNGTVVGACVFGDHLQ